MYGRNFLNLNKNSYIIKTELKGIRKTGYGHWKVTITFRNGKDYNTTITDSMLIDDYNSDVFFVKDSIKIKRAEKRLIRKVKNANRLPD